MWGKITYLGAGLLVYLTFSGPMSMTNLLAAVFLLATDNSAEFHSEFWGLIRSCCPHNFLCDVSWG